jgi:hypothetical protein
VIRCRRSRAWRWLRQASPVVVSVTRMSSNAGTKAACGEAYRQVDAPSRVVTSAHAPQPAQLEGVRVVRGVTLDPGG